MKEDITERVDLPGEVAAEIVGDLLTVRGPKGEVSRVLRAPNVSIDIKESSIIVQAKSATKREKRMIYTFVAHISNMVKGVIEPFVYKLKICSGHFPMNVSVQNDKLQVKNFLGEKSPRSVRLKKGAKVSVSGDIITVESPDKELAGNVASDIELLTAVSNRDLRVFQDGIYMVEKAGSKVGE